MENSYGIGVRNRYELFYDDDVDPLDLLKQTEKKKKDKSAEKENKATKAPKAKEITPVTKSTKSEIAPKTTTEKTSNSVITKPIQTKAPRNNEARVKFSDREERNNRRNKPEGEQRENRESRDFRENRDTKDPRETRENATPSQRFDGGDTRGGGRGRGIGFNRGRGGRRGTGGGGRGDFRGKREFDRQSGMVTSGVKPVDKREGSGSFNWGSDKDQITEEQLQNDNTELDTSGENTEKVPLEEGAVPPEEDTAKEDDGQKEMTLDEWKALQKREKPVFKVRRPGEGENTAQWKKTYVLKKKVEEETSEEEEEEDEEIEVHHGRKKVLLPFDFQFADTPSRGRGRGRGRGGVGGRARGMGGRGRGSRYQGSSRQEAPKMDDERDFPSLG